ncbi:MAG TPA: GAF domain-containing protein [Acidimicrobiia bacterium]|nr:GAF domain-containing protein [Acidimicrobiia bacterium]
MQPARPPTLGGGTEAKRRSPQNSEASTIRTPDSGGQLREAERRLRSVVTGAPVILFALDPQGTITLSEGAALAALGLEPGASVGKSVFDVYQDQPEALSYVHRALAGEAVAAILTIREVTFAVHFSPQFDQDGELDHVIGVATDITPQQRAETELHRLVAFDRLAHRIFTDFIEIAPDDSATPEQFDAAILQALAEVGRFGGAARSYILEKSDLGDVLTNTYEWCAEGVEPAAEALREIRTETIPWLMDQIDNGRVLHVPAIGDLPPQIAPQVETFGCKGIQAMVNLPMTSRGHVVGLVGFDWTDSSSELGRQPDIAQLTVIQNLFANALQQRRIGGDLQKKNRLLRAVLECSDALIRARDEDVLLEEVCRIVVEVGGFSQAWVGFDVGDEERSITPVAHWGYSDGYLEGLKITWDDSKRGRGPMGRAIRTRAPAGVENIATDADYEPWRAEALARGCRSAMAIPLVFGDELLGGIIVYASEPWAFDALEVEILERFAGYLAYGIVALRTQARRQAAESQLRDSLRSKEQLIASISHEMRTPLTAVVGFAQLLQMADSGLSAEERSELIRSIALEGLDLTNIVDDLLTAAKAEAGTLTVVKVPVDLRANAAQVLETLSEPQRIELSGSTVRVVGDPGRVRQILRNLISNALRYGGEDIRVSVIDDPSPRVQVRDNGRGIPLDEQERIFDPYERAHDAPGLTASMGLGLTISRSLARLMGGDLTYRYEGGESIFELLLPRFASEAPGV